MAGGIAIKLDASKVVEAYSTTLRRLASLSGFDQRAVLRAEAGSILKTWAGRVPIAKKSQVEARARNKAIHDLGYTKASDRGDVTVNTGRKAPYGRVWIKVRSASGRGSFILAMGANFTQPSGKGVFNKYAPRQSATTQKWVANIADAVADVPGAVDRATKAGFASVGLAAQSVIQIADSLNIDLTKVAGGGISPSNIAKARNAIASDGKAYRNGVGASGGDEVRPYVELINSLPFGRKIGLDQKLLGVLSGRSKQFEHAYAAAFFVNAEKTAKQYPNLFRVTTRN